MVHYLVRILEQGNASGEFHVAEPRRDAEVLLYSIAYFYPHALMTMVRYPTVEELLSVVDWFIQTFQRPRVNPAKPSTRPTKNKRVVQTKRAGP